ncbi:MAG: tol-pal system protein YbgF [Rhizobiaceae bacterium]|nr:tol-pal system protein YbgF [Rhizobiaceae bacterium]
MKFWNNLILKIIPDKCAVAIFSMATVFIAMPSVYAAIGDNQLPRPQINIGSTPAPNLQFAQAANDVTRINQLEEHIRRLSGQIEEMNFQMLQLQETIRRMQEDNEFRFQELENKRSGSLEQPNSEVAENQAKDDETLGKPLPSDVNDANSTSDGNIEIAGTGKKKRMIDGVEIFDGGTSDAAGSGGEQPLGTITFDSAGNIVDTALGKPLDLTMRLGNEAGGLKNSAEQDFSSISSARELYELGFDYFQAGDYSTAQKVFTAYVERYPDENKSPNAQFWLGESMLSQADFEGAAKVFLDAQTNWPEAKIAPQMMLKLGISLAGMEQRELACATYAKVYSRYPDISNTLRKRVGAEQKSARCLNG